MREGRLQRDGVGLHYVEWLPDGPELDPAIFLLHGLSSNSLFWARLAGNFGRRRVVALDQRSHGRSDRPERGYAGSVLVADAAFAIEALGLVRPVVAGHSWGAAVALELVVTHPRLASGLAFVDGSSRPLSERMTWEEASRVMQPPLPRYASIEDAAAAQRVYLEDAWEDDLLDFVRAGLSRDGEAWVLTLTAPVREQILRALYDYQPQLLWPVVGVPVLAAFGSRMPEFMAEWRRSSVELLKELCPQADVRWYDSAHDVPVIRPAELAADVERLCLRAAWQGVALEVLALGPELQWSRPSGFEAWSAKDLLAHISSTQAAMPAVARSRPDTAAGAVPFDSDRWNASQVRRRSGLPVPALMEEVRVAAQELDQELAASALNQPIGTGRYSGQPLGAAMEAMLEHQRGHLGQLLFALAAPSRAGAADQIPR